MRRSSPASADDHRDPDGLVAGGARRRSANCSQRSRPRRASAPSPSTAPRARCCRSTPTGDRLAAPLMYNDPVEDDRRSWPRSPRIAPTASAAHGATSGLAKALRFQRSPACDRCLHQADWIAGQLLRPLRRQRREQCAEDRLRSRSARRWPDWIAATGVRIELLPEWSPAGSPVGRSPARRRRAVRPAAAMSSSSPARRMAAPPSSRPVPTDPATASRRSASSLTLKILSDRPIFAPQFGIYSHRIGDAWLAGGASNTGGEVLAALFHARAHRRTLSRQIDPRRRPASTTIRCSSTGERFPIADPRLAAAPVAATGG